MAQIGTLTGGAGVVTSFNGLTQLDEFLVVGDSDTANPLQGLTVEVNGETLINIQVQALITAFGKWLMEMNGSTVSTMIKVATGRIKGSTNIRLINAGATTPAVYAFSDSDGGLPFISATEVILAGSYSDYSGFSSLMISAPANVQSAIVTFADGYTATVTPVELAAYFSLENNSEADGYLGGVLVVDNRSNRISSIRIFATGANVNVLKVQIPNE
jgi:hypothetical protein